MSTCCRMMWDICVGSHRLVGSSCDPPLITSNLAEGAIDRKEIYKRSEREQEVFICPSCDDLSGARVARLPSFLRGALRGQPYGYGRSQALATYATLH